MYISFGKDRLSCKLFSGTLRGVAMQWMATLPAKSIQAFSDLASSFVSQFAANKVKKLEVTDLFNIKQARGESLKSYLFYFNNATVRGLRVGPFSDAMALRRSSSMEEIRARVEKHVEVEEDQIERLEAECANHKDVKRSSHQRVDPKQFPPEVKGRVMGPNKDGWCDFHRVFGHLTEECWSLKTQIEKLVQEGHFGRFVRCLPNKGHEAEQAEKGERRGRSSRQPTARPMEV
ncbi:hypothetical protein CR513_23945, partial [Mucuna pruriens]